MPDFTLAPESAPPAATPMLIPHLILEQYARGQAGGRFSAASLFADISGFSAVTNVLLAQGSEAAESLVYVCFGSEPQAVHRQVLTRVSDRLLVLYQEHSPLPDQWDG